MGFARPRFDIAGIVRLHRRALEAEHRLTRSQKRVLTAISRCRTAALGGHLEVCTGCGREHPVYNSCRNRHCPKCQALAQQKWIDAWAERILPVRHFHVVFTPPSELRPLAMRHPTEVYTALFRSVSELLLELGRTHLGATLGQTMVLHTWTRELHFHPHIHVLVTAGGLSLDGQRFVHTRKDFLFPVKVMGQLLRGKMLDALRKLYRKGVFPELNQEAFNRLMASLATHKSWVVYSKAPFRGLAI
ncbi:MAG: transposase zinc-binding domain-containing protein [Geothrix sp.]|nr:transposase zinc-binding domain-containing protein [Geothrix sp.]